MYGACNEDPQLRRDVFGTSVGWSDVYPYSYPEQWIDVTGLRGRFAFVQIADGIEGLVHVSEISADKRINPPQDVLRAGQVVKAQVLGIDGLVCSPKEAGAIRKVVSHQMKLVTPGIRPAGAASGDQKRIMTPARAIAAGADYLVVGRPVLEAIDPRATAEAIQAAAVTSSVS